MLKSTNNKTYNIILYYWNKNMECTKLINLINQNYTFTVTKLCLKTSHICGKICHTSNNEYLINVNIQKPFQVNKTIIESSKVYEQISH